MPLASIQPQRLESWERCSTAYMIVAIPSTTKKAISTRVSETVPLIGQRIRTIPAAMLTAADTALSGSLSHLDLPGVMQMLGQAHQTGALHINASEIDGIIFFEGGEIFHSECGTYFGDEAVTQIVKTCQSATAGVYKFVYGATAAQRTVLRSATDLLLDAMREFDEDQLNEEEKLEETDHAEKESS